MRTNRAFSIPGRLLGSAILILACGAGGVLLAAEAAKTECVTCHEQGAKLANSVPILTFEGGHMTYNTDASRAPLKNAMVSFYRATRGGASQSAAK